MKKDGSQSMIYIAHAVKSGEERGLCYIGEHLN